MHLPFSTALTKHGYHRKRPEMVFWFKNQFCVKGDFFDGTVRLNATYYDSEIDDLQTSRFDPSNVAFLVFIENVGDAEVRGVDADFTWLANDNLTISGALSWVDSEITRLNPQLDGIAVPVGSKLPYTGDFSFNVRARYDFRLEALNADAYFQVAISHTDDSMAGIVGNAYLAEDVARRVYGQPTGLKISEEGGTFSTNSVATALSDSIGLTADGQFFKSSRYVQEAYTLVNVSFGFQMENLGVELFIASSCRLRDSLPLRTSPCTAGVSQLNALSRRMTCGSI